MIDVDSVVRAAKDLWREGDVDSIDLVVDLPEQTLTVTLRRHPIDLRPLRDDE